MTRKFIDWSKRTAWLGLGLLCCCVAATVHAQSSAVPERRVALVVGNSSYRVGPLKNPQNDARAVASALRKLNFEVIERQNLGREAFSLAIRDFGDRLKGANVSLFYYAGHGLQVKGRNYLVPVDADIAREDEVPYRSLDVNEVLDKMDSARTSVNLVLLDACRNNPFARSFKLGQVGLAQMDAPQGTLISFATAPGSVAQDGEGLNGLFTGALLKHIGTQGLAVEQMLKRVRVDVVRESNSQQVPWESSSLNRDFSFALSTFGPVANQAPLGATGTTELALELAFWEAIRASRNPADYRAYLEQYPQGRFASLARVRVQPVPADQAAAAVPIQAVPQRVPAERNSRPEVLSEVRLPWAAGDVAQGFAGGRLRYRLEGSAERSVDLGSSAPVTALAVSPEGVYLVALSGRQLYWVDLERASVLRHAYWSASSTASVLALQFSATGRWLLLKTQDAGQGGYQLIEVSTGESVWQKPSVTATFDVNRPGIRLEDAAGHTEWVDLPSS